MSKSNSGTYFLINETIVYSLDTAEERALDHYDLWPKVVHKLFSHLGFEDRQDLILNAAYGADRGRVVEEDGVYRLYGAPGSEKFKYELVGIFGEVQKTDFRTDLHYRVIIQDKDALYFMIRLHKLSLQAGTIYIPGPEESSLSDFNVVVQEDEGLCLIRVTATLGSEDLRHRRQIYMKLWRFFFRTFHSCQVLPVVGVVDLEQAKRPIELSHMSSCCCRVPPLLTILETSFVPTSRYYSYSFSKGSTCSR